MGRMSENLQPNEQQNTSTRPHRTTLLAFDVCLVILILIGVYFRFNWVNWNQDTDLHPDEYGLTSTLTQLSMPKTLADYFNTRLSPISPYQKYDENGNPTQNGPDNRMRWGQWPIIILRGSAEMLDKAQAVANVFLAYLSDTNSPLLAAFGGTTSLTRNNTGYGEIRLMGRSLSALADTLSLLVLFLIGSRLYGRRAGLLAAALGSLAVMQIQQSHFMTVDNFAAFFTTLALYACVRIMQTPPVVRPPELATGQARPYRIAWQAAAWYVLFGLAFGMALASKVNLLPLGGMLLVAGLIGVADVKLKTINDLRRIFVFTVLLLALGTLVSLATFRVTQPMSFRATTGNTTLLTLTPNSDWMDSMKVASAESNGDGGGPPGEQWAHRTLVVFALVNMVMWGMGLPLGLACWLAFGAAFWQVIHGRSWRAHLLLLVWAGGYFIFMGTRWVMSTRYFLPIYPSLCLLAAWGLLELWKWAQSKQSPLPAQDLIAPFSWQTMLRDLDRAIAYVQKLLAPVLIPPVRRLIAVAALGITILGTLAWANAFTQAVYATPHTRIQAAHWIYQHIDGPFQLALRDEHGNTVYDPIPAQDGLQINSTSPYTQSFVAPFNGQLTQVTLPHVQADARTTLQLAISPNPDGQNPFGTASIPVSSSRSESSGVFKNIQLIGGTTYYLVASVADAATVSVFENVLANESWDEGLPMPFEGHDPFGGLYHGLTMEVRWPDAENKKQMFLDTLAQVDYIILPSQRAIWSTCRIPLTYPMTMDYYRALFDGRLGFQQVAAFSAPIKLGPLWVSDVGGTFAWNQTPALPLFNHSGLAAEEAFSVYDHPPVWIFKKRADFDIARVKAILDATDLSKVIDQGPRQATGDWCPAQ